MSQNSQIISPLFGKYVTLDKKGLTVIYTYYIKHSEEDPIVNEVEKYNLSCTLCIPVAICIVIPCTKVSVFEQG